MEESIAMMFHCPAQSHTLNVTSQQTVQAQLETAIAYDQMPWLLPALLKLERLQATGHDIPGIGDLTIHPDTASLVRQFFSRITVDKLPVPQIASISGGGIGITWTRGQKEAAFTVFPQEDHFAYMLANEADEIVRDGLLTVDQQNLLNSALRWLLVA